VDIGRALDNHVVLDDPHAAPHHARLAPDGAGRLTLTVLPGRNGIVHEGQHYNAGAALELPAGGATLHIGATRLRLRLRGETLAPEQALPALAPGSRALLPLTGAALLALLLGSHGVSLDPGADYSAWLPMLVGLPLVIAGWTAAWALMSKLFRHRFDFLGHLRIVLPWLLVMSLADVLWPQFAAAIAAPGLWQLTAPLQALLAALLVRAHLAHVLPQHQRAVTVAVAVAALSGGAISLALTHRRSDSFSSAPYMSTLPMPALRLAGTVPSKALVQEMGPLAARLTQRARAARAEDDEGESAAE
jgi:hypothetical protein